jgi:hypothetical protein
MPFVALAGAHGVLCGLDAEGQAWCRGANSHGQLGDGTTIARTAFAPVVGTQRFRELVAGDRSTCALDLDHHVWCWGDSRPLPSLVPTRMSIDIPMGQLGFSGWAACAIGLVDRQLYCGWGGDMEGVPSPATEMVGVPSGGSLIDLVGIDNLGVFLWAGGRVGFAGDMIHQAGVNRRVRRPSDLSSAPGDVLPPLPDGFSSLVSRGGEIWCGAHSGGATLCSQRVQALVGVPIPN